MSQIEQSGLPKPQRQYRFSARRRFLADFSWPEYRLLAEVQGGVWVRGRHVTGDGYLKDCIRLNLATLEGWRMLYFTSSQIDDGSAVDVIAQALGIEQVKKGSDDGLRRVKGRRSRRAGGNRESQC